MTTKMTYRVEVLTQDGTWMATGPHFGSKGLAERERKVIAAYVAMDGIAHHAGKGATRIGTHQHTY